VPTKEKFALNNNGRNDSRSTRGKPSDENPTPSASQRHALLPLPHHHAAFQGQLPPFGHCHAD
jgi:hypothetical protein